MACSKCAERARLARERREAQRARVREAYDAKRQAAIESLGLTDQNAEQQRRRRM